MWETDCELSGTGAAGKIQRESAAFRSHHETRKFDVAFSAGRGGSGHGAQAAGVAQSILPSDDASRAEDGKGGDVPPTRHSVVLDVASKFALRVSSKIRFAGSKISSHAVVIKGSIR